MGDFQNMTIISSVEWVCFKSFRLSHFWTGISNRYVVETISTIEPTGKLMGEEAQNFKNLAVHDNGHTDHDNGHSDL
jgi:hypothetical protein